jgi:hypothetical protein
MHHRPGTTMRTTATTSGTTTAATNTTTGTTTHNNTTAQTLAVVGLSAVSVITVRCTVRHAPGGTLPRVTRGVLRGAYLTLCARDKYA